MNTTTEIIHKEHFEHWLFSQEDSREFDYSDNFGCMGCAFVKETTIHQEPFFGCSFWRVDSRNCGSAPIPRFLIRVLNAARKPGNIIFTIADTKRAWLKLFPETVIDIQPAQSVKEVK